MVIVKQGIESFISTNLKQNRPVWDSATTYAYQDEVFHKNYIYRSMVDGNKNIDPSINSGKWLLWGVDNSYAAIDLRSSTDSIMDDGLTFIEYEFYSLGFNIVAMGGTYCSSVDLYEYDGTDTLIRTTSKTGVLPRDTIDWYSYYFTTIGDTERPIDIVFTSILPPTVKIKVIINSRASNAYIGSMVGGVSYDIGDTEFGVTGGFIDYSIRETDSNGITTIKKRNVKETLSGSVVMPAVRTQGVKRFIKSVMGEVAMFVFDPSTDSNYENLIMLGYITDFGINLVNATKTYGTIEIEENL